MTDLLHLLWARSTAQVATAFISGYCINHEHESYISTPVCEYSASSGPGIYPPTPAHSYNFAFLISCMLLMLFEMSFLIKTDDDGSVDYLEEVPVKSIPNFKGTVLPCNL